MRQLIAILFLCIGVVVAMWSWQKTRTECESVLSYRIGEVDAEFGLDEIAFRDIAERAVQMWEQATGRTLFTYDPTASFTLNLVFDDRQRNTIAGQQLSRQLEQTEASRRSVDAHQERWQAIYDARHRAYEQARLDFNKRLDTYNATVEALNEQGSTSSERYEALNAERDELAQQQAWLESEYEELEEVRMQVVSLSKQNTSLVKAYNHDARTYNALHGDSEPFHKGEYNGRHITVYQYQDKADLTLVLAHELGHALGIQHVNAPEAIMHPLMGAQNLDQLELTPVDIKAFEQICSPNI